MLFLVVVIVVVVAVAIVVVLTDVFTGKKTCLSFSRDVILQRYLFEIFFYIYCIGVGEIVHLIAARHSIETK